MKQLILGTVFGKIALSVRVNLILVWAVLTSPRKIETIINDQLASLLVVKLCQSQKTFIDVGAHLGSVTSSVLDHDPSIIVIAIEASQEKSERLIRKFPDIELHQCAVGDTEGDASFFVNTRQSGFNSLGKPSKKDIDNYVEIIIPIKRLDSIISSDEVDVIKIDVEGAELGVVRGGEKLISINRPVVMFESGPTKDDGLGFSREDLWNWFNDRNFDILVPNRVAYLGPGLTKDGFLE